MKNHLRKFACLIAISSAMLVEGCSDEGSALINPTLCYLQFNPVVKDPMLFEISIGDRVIAENISKSSAVLLQFLHDPIHLKVRDQVNNRIVFDSIYHQRSAPYTLFSVYQQSPGNGPRYIAPPASEEGPVADHFKASIVYSLADLPDKVWVVMEENISGNTFMASDSVLLEKEAFSPFFSIKGNVSTTSQFMFYSTDYPRRLLGRISNYRFNVSEESPLRIYSVGEGEPIGNDVFDLVPTILY